jgi:hypothetical protein
MFKKTPDIIICRCTITKRAKSCKSFTPYVCKVGNLLNWSKALLPRYLANVVHKFTGTLSQPLFILLFIVYLYIYLLHC